MATRGSGGGATVPNLRTASGTRTVLVVAFDTALALGTAAIGLAVSGASSGAATPPPPQGWTAAQAQLPATPPPTSSPGTYFGQEACSAPTKCIVPGYYDTAGGEPLIEQESGSAWTSVVPPLPAGAEGASLFGATAEPNGTLVAVGAYKTSSQAVPLIETWSGGIWTPTALPIPAGTPSNEGGYLKSIQCPQVGDCVGLGIAPSAGGGIVSFSEIESNGSWTAAPVPLASGTGSGSKQFTYLKSLSCPSVGDCVAVGSYKDSNPTPEIEDAVVATLSGGVWSTQLAPLPGAYTDSFASTVSCPSAGNCVAVGTAGGASSFYGYIDTLADGTWSSALAPTASAGEESYLLGVSCTTDGFCAAVGTEATSGLSAYALTRTNGSWTQAAVAEPANGAPSSSGLLTGVDCVSAQACTAVGEYEDSSSNQQAFFATLATPGSPGAAAKGVHKETAPPPTWSSVETPVPAGAASNPKTSPINQEEFLTAPVCFPQGGCGATFSYTDTSDKTQTALETYTPAQGYSEVASDGGLFNYGTAYYGSASQLPLNKPIVGMANTPNAGGYWQVASDGGIFNYGDAGFYGSAGSLPLNKPIVGMAPTPDGGGYWLVASDGGIFNYGDAGYYGSAGSIALNKPIVGIAATPDGKGYWLVASDGGIFAYGDAQFYGSMGSQPLNKPIVGIASTGSGGGYWEVASDGGIFNFGDAPYAGSASSMPLNKPIVAIVPTYDGEGYWEIANDGGLFNYGDASFLGSAASQPLVKPVNGGAAL